MKFFRSLSFIVFLATACAHAGEAQRLSGELKNLNMQLDGLNDSLGKLGMMPTRTPKEEPKEKSAYERQMELEREREERESKKEVAVLATQADQQSATDIVKQLPDLKIQFNASPKSVIPPHLANNKDYALVFLFDKDVPYIQEEEHEQQKATIAAVVEHFKKNYKDLIEKSASSITNPIYVFFSDRVSQLYSSNLERALKNDLELGKIFTPKRLEHFQIITPEGGNYKLSQNAVQTIYSFVQQFEK
ncbi:MAG: hypothetical protein AB7R69_00590 [Candidatus Babeliales bacterium]